MATRKSSPKPSAPALAIEFSGGTINEAVCALPRQLLKTVLLEPQSFDLRKQLSTGMYNRVWRAVKSGVVIGGWRSVERQVAVPLLKQAGVPHIVAQTRTNWPHVFLRFSNTLPLAYLVSKGAGEFQEELRQVTKMAETLTLKSNVKGTYAKYNYDVKFGPHDISFDVADPEVLIPLLVDVVRKRIWTPFDCDPAVKFAQY